MRLMGKGAISMGLVALLAVLPCAAGTVTLGVSSPSNGLTVAPGVTIDWSITLSVSSGDNAGLALVLVDLAQDAGNPETIEIPPADGVPAAMSDFDAPAGVSNPVAGYRGTPLGPAGAQDLRQIGGMQNTFGTSGGAMGADVNVDGGIGQGSPQLLAQGSFTAPATSGTYMFNIENGIANVLQSVETAPDFSPVSSATVVLSVSAFSFTVAPDCPGDIDNSGAVDLTDLGILLGNYGTGTTPEQGDLTGDHTVDLTDLGILLGNYGPC